MKLILSLCIICTMLCPVSGCTQKELSPSGNTSYQGMTGIGNTRNGGDVINDGTGGICIRSNDTNGDLTGIKREKDGVTYDIATEGIGPLLFCYKDWIYYREAETQNLNRINYNTKQIQTVLDEMCIEAVIKDEMLYCIILPERSLYEFSLLENQSKENGSLVLDNGASNLLLYDDDIYYIQGSTLFKGIDEQIEIVSGLKTDLLFILNDNLYYVDAVDGLLYQRSLSGSPNAVSDDYRPEFINVMDGKLIFVAYDDRAILRTYTYDPSKKSVKRYSKCGYGNICIGNGKVYECVITDEEFDVRCLD